MKKLKFINKNKSSIESELLDRFEDSVEVSYRDRNVKLKENKVWQ